MRSFLEIFFEKTRHRTAANRLAADLLVWVWLLALVSGTSLSALQVPNEERQPKDQEGAWIRSRVDAVLLDLVVRDEKGKPIRDLRAEEITIFEDGVQQEILSFRSRQEGFSVEAQQEKEVGRPRLEWEGPVEIDPFRHISLVSLVFDRLSVDGRFFSRQGAIDFLESGLNEDTLVAVFIIDHRLHVLQQFTNDRKQLRAAINRATSGEYAKFPSESDAIQHALEEVSVAGSRAETASSSAGRGSPPGPEMAAAFAQQTLAQMTVNMLQRAEELSREQQGIASIYSILALVGEQRRLAGRKTLLYFSEGLHAPPDLVDRFRYAIGEANQANVSVYAVDARGLGSVSQMASTEDLLRQTAQVSRNQALFGVGRAVTREEVMISENAEASLRMNLQGTLADLAESTGGFLIANTNDVRPGIRQLKEDLEIYYEVAYMPRNLSYDGTFRQIKVEVSRPGVSVQTRSGYFAMPPRSEGPPILPYEIPLLAALSSSPLPEKFPYFARAMRFNASNESVHYSLVMEIPLSNITFIADEKNKNYDTRFSLIALIKDSGGEVVHKITQDYPLRGPLEKLESLKLSHILFIRQFHLKPGTYRIETAVHDYETNRSSARRSYLPVPAPADGVGMSSLSIIRRIDPVESAEGDKNPFVVEKGKIVPDLLGLVEAAREGLLSIFLVVYPSPEMPEKPALRFEFLQDGKSLGQTVLDLPPPDSEGKIPYIVTFPIGEFQPGRYEVRAVADQGATSAVEHGFFTVEPH